VNGGGGAKEEPFAPRKVTTAEQTLETCERCLRQKTPLTHETTVLTLEGQAHLLT
jgi:hypothetical protein